MAKYLRIRDKLLLGLAVAGDFFFEITKSPYVREKQARGVLPPDYKVSNFTGAVLRMLKTGYLEKVIKDGEPYLRLTGQGEKALIRDFPLLEIRKKKWDGLWRIVFYDIAEVDQYTRSALRRRLRELGFGQLQRSVYISPLDVATEIKEFVTNQNLEEAVFLAVARNIFSNNKSLAEKVWRLDKLNERYADFLSDLESFIGGKKGLTLNQLYTLFETILLDDPLLPRELLPDWWRGNEALQKMKDLLRKQNVAVTHAN